ncbi:nucleotidyl transferase AbiEii/AbiGii toxin family protein [Yinghuangia seranimata]|uniref:nucleotidyl transferase AbiEii/AbiGii toxin family protein n=1 Tax=Yinghuangia seranimata TaxID=408067 RepID=UPI00248CE053|nr:nucleotidyl transferase AbiEii/AbiGii toxin family protein [Yinghuangia seranimata]MDI2129622.1 nucleotidyl transferase AbiEii/AbiGii toxin family protein [Yinghuangia seranimata]
MPISDAHRAVLDHVLAVLAGSSWSASLVLRGSMVMPAWVGDRAREPGDLDWIVLPDEEPDWLYADDEFGPALVEELRTLMPAHEDVRPGLRLHGADVTADSSWGYAYEGSVGVRVLIPWSDGGVEGTPVQVDFARDEVLPEPPVWTRVPRADAGPPVAVRTASRELSLAWKLLWMHSDAYGDAGCAQGKDLYDAVLLAESADTGPCADLVRRVLRDGIDPDIDPDIDSFGPGHVRWWSVDWFAFQAANPHVHGDADAWQGRLERALWRLFGTP